MGRYLTENKTKDRYTRYKEGYEKYRKVNNSKIKEIKEREYDKYQIARQKWIQKNRDKWLNYRKKNNNKRRRGFGFYQLNNSFNGSVAHHINKEVVINIPKELHNSIKHNLWSGENMDKINKLAFQFLEKLR